MIVGGFDTLYHHELTERRRGGSQPGRLPTSECITHTMLTLNYGLVLVALLLKRWAS